jgi:sulfite dehydrogenase (quinone) subunit SoeC
MIFFTTLIGAAQGLVLALVGIDSAAGAGLLAAAPGRAFYLAGSGTALVLCAFGLVAATFHLGQPLRAWRAAAMWRTSWLSREVIVLPLFMACVLGWSAAQWLHGATLGWGVACALLALALFVCTGMIYAAVKVIAEWATPLTPLNYLLLGTSSGLLLCGAIAAAVEPRLAPAIVVATLIGLPIAVFTRLLTGWRNARLAPKTTTQSAIGVRHPRIVQVAQGMTAGSFGTREFFHGRSPAVLRAVRAAALVLGAVLPLAVLLAGGAALGALAAAFVLQYLGLLAERWTFFAEGRHPQNLYHQAR